MGTLIVVIVVMLAVVTAGSIIFLAWELTSKETQDALERSLGHDAGKPPNTHAGSPAEPPAREPDEPGATRGPPG